MNGHESIRKIIFLSRYGEDANQNSKCMIAEKHLNDKVRRRLSRTRKLWSNPRITRFQRPILEIWEILSYHRVKYRTSGGVD
jgi:hypothetical protein